jgi:hypothetical protein
VAVYAAVRGWLECDDTQLALLRQVIDGDPARGDGGWAFPANPTGWINYVFYGADLQAPAVDRLLDQLRRLAALPASDEDDDRIRGLFFNTHEVDGMAQWQVRDGLLHVSAVDPAYAYLGTSGGSAVLREISAEAYERSAPLCRIIVHDSPRRFAALRLPGTSQQLTLCWRSDLVEPILAVDPWSSSLWVGVDQRLAGVSAEGRLLFSIGLMTSLLDIRHVEGFTVALCDGQLVAVNRDHSVRAIYDLRDVPDTVDAGEGRATVRYVDGHETTHPL